MTKNAAHPRFTVAVPTLNRCDTYLPAAIQAVLDQTYPDFELLVSDNGSTDGTESYMRSLRDARIRYIRRTVTVPAGEHFSALSNEARGDWLVLHQDDDLLNRNFLERAHAALETNPGCNMYAAPIWRQVRYHGYHARLLRPQHGYNDAQVLGERVELLDGNYAATQLFDPIRHWVHPTVAIRASALHAVGGYDSGNTYQSDLVTQARVLINNQLMYDPRPGGISHVHPTNFMRGKPRSFRKHFFRTTYVKLIDAFEERNADWRVLLATYLDALSTQEIIDCLNEWTYYRTPRELQRIGFSALRKTWGGSRLGLARKCLSRIGPRNLARYALCSISDRPPRS